MRGLCEFLYNREMRGTNSEPDAFLPASTDPRLLSNVKSRPQAPKRLTPLKRLALIIAVVLLLAVSGAFILREMGWRIRTNRLHMETVWLVPALTHLVTSYMDTYHEQGSWPKPGTIYDDSALPYLSTRQKGEDRIDTYGTFMADRRIDVVLGADGTIQAWVVDGLNDQRLQLSSDARDGE